MDWPIHDGIVLIKQKRSLLFFHSVIWIIGSCLGIFLFLGLFFGWGYVVNDESHFSKSENFLGTSLLLLMTFISIPKSFIMIRDIFRPKVVFAYNDNGFYLRNGKFFVPWSNVLKVVILHILAIFNRPFDEENIMLKFRKEHLFVKSLTVLDKLIYLSWGETHGCRILICFKYTGENLAKVFPIFMKKCPQAVFIK